MKQSLLFLNNVIELKFFVIEDGRGVLKLQNTYKTELDELALKSRSDLVQKIKAFTDVKTREPCITTYPLTIVESLIVRGREEWLIQQGIGDVDKKVETWSYVEQVKPRHGIAAPLKRDKVSLSGQIFCFLPLPLYSGLPVHINGHFILNSTRRNLWTSTDPDRDDDKSRWNKNILQAIASSYVHFLERITEHYAHAEGFTDRATLERDAGDYYLSFPRCTYKKVSTSEQAPLSEPWLQLARQVFQIMAEHNSPILAVPTKASLRSSEDKHFMQWQPLISEQLPESQVHFWKSTGEDKKLRPILERVGMKITCAPLWIMNHLKEAKCEIPVISRSSVYDFYMAFNTRFISDHFPQNIEDMPFKSVEDFKIFTAFLLEPQPASVPYVLVFGSNSAQSIFPKEPFDYPLLLTADNQLRIFDKANKVLCSKYANLFPQCPDRFLHKDLLELSYSLSYFVSASDNETVRVTVIKELLESVLPEELKNMYVSHGSEAIKEVDMKSLWKCFSNDEVFKSVLSEVLKVWALLLTKDGRFFRCGSSEQLLPIIALKAEKSYSTVALLSDDVAASVAIEQMLNAPFLDTEVVPIDTVSLLCPKFSDPKRILKNLYYLHREFPFTETITVDNADKLLCYFAKVHLKKEPQCWPTLKCLPLFETINGALTPLQGKRVYVWPDRICQVGNDNWLRGTDLVFLKPYAAWSTLGVASELGICRISAEKTYVQFIFPNFFKLKKEQRYRHLKHIRDYLFVTNFVNQKNRNWDICLPATRFVSGLTNLQCIGDDGKPLQTVSSFYTHKKMIFITFPEHFQILPKDILQREEQSWINFFHKLGLQNKVTEQDYLILCNNTADGKLREKTKTASGILLKYLFSENENKLHGFHNHPKFLRKVSDIAFVCPVPLPELEWIHKVPQTPHCVTHAGEEIPLCKLSGSCLTPAKDLVWAVVPIVSVSTEQQHVLKNLGIHIEPKVHDVMKNITLLSKTAFANPAHFMKYTAPHRKESQTNLMDVVSNIFKFLQTVQSQIDLSELKTIPCIPVHVITDESGGQFPVLVEPYCVVCRDVKETKPYYPFIHSVPSRLYVAKELLDALGVENSLQLRHMQIVLESAFKFSNGMKLEPNTLEVVHCAVRELESLLQKNKHEKEETIVKKLTPLYLSGSDKRMHHVDSLVYTRIRDINLCGTNLYLLWTPKKYYPKEFCELFPKALRPKSLSELCTSKVSTSCKICDKTENAANLENTLQIPSLSQAMCIVVKHVTGKMGSSVQERVCEEFEEHLLTFLHTLEVRCVEQLRIDMFLKNHDMCNPVASKSVKCYIQREELSYYLYMDSNVASVYISDVHKCIAKELVRCMKETPLVNEELKVLKIEECLQLLLQASSQDEVYEILRESEMNCSELEYNFDTDEPQLGNLIPKWLLNDRLDLSNNNIFQPQEWVAYQLTDERLIYAQVVHPVSLKDPSGQPLKPIQIEYIIFTSAEDEEGKKVKAIDLFKFIRGEKPPVDAIPADPDCQELVPFEGDPDDTSAHHEPLSLQQMREEIRQEVQDIRQLSGDDRRKAIRRLYLRWHPDKNPDCPELTEEAFKFLQEELDKLERGIEPSASASSFSRRSWRNYQESWDNTARERRYYSQQYQHSTSQGGKNSGMHNNTASSSRQRRSHGGGGGFFGGNFTPPTNEREGKRWVRQAIADCKALEALLNEARRDAELSCHVCFMAHEVAEKALKGGMYVTCGLGETSLKSHNISPLGKSIEAVRQAKASGLAALTSPLEPYYLDTRFPNCCLPPSTPDNFSLSNAETAAECARGILKIVRDIVSIT